jgi:hypothetical protein
LLENLDGKEKVSNFALAFEKHHNGGWKQEFQATEVAKD